METLAFERAAVFGATGSTGREIVALYDRPVILESTRIRALLGALQLTPYAEGVRRTLDGLE